jgi:hypothetical protein
MDMSDLPVPPAIAKIAPDGNLTPRQKRRFMIDMLLRRAKPGTGSSHEFMRRRTADIPWPDLRPILTGIDWAIIGTVATRAYMPERMTRNLDIIVSKRDGKAAVTLLEQAGYRILSPLAIPGFLLNSPEGAEVDIIFGDFPWLKDALSQPMRDSAGYPVIALPYLILLKLSAGRIRDWGDLGTLLGWASDADLDAVRAVVKRYAPQDVEDLEAFIFIGKKEQEIPPSDETGRQS